LHIRNRAHYQISGWHRNCDIVKRETGSDFPQEPIEQLRLAIGAVFRSWNNKRAIDYRNYNKIPHSLGTAVNIVTMVFGNMGFDSGTGVAFTRDPATGEKKFFGEFLAIEFILRQKIFGSVFIINTAIVSLAKLILFDLDPR